MKKYLTVVLTGSLLVSMFLLGMISSANGQVAVSDIQAAISASGANWVAGENHITRLSPAEQKRLLGVKNAPKPDARPPATVTSAYGLPASLDWRNNGGNYVTAVKDQGSCGSCWAFSAVAALESATLIANKTPNTELNLAEQVLVSCCDTTCSPSGDCGGGWPERAADFLRDRGAPLESCYPYVGSGTCGNTCPNWQASAYRAKSWQHLVHYDQNEAPTVDAIKAGLQFGPVTTTFAVYSDFMSYLSGAYKHVSGTLQGYHDVLTVGYDDAGQYFIVKNSWGTGWGEQGYFRIAYSEVTGYSSFGYEAIAYYAGDNPNPAPTCNYSLADYISSGGGTGTVQVSVPDGVGWRDESDAYWMTVDPTGGLGSKTLTYTVAPNANKTARIAALDIGPLPWITDKAFQRFYAVYQDAGPSQCTYFISPATASYDKNGGTGKVTVTAPPGCPWAVQSTAYYVTITSPKSGSGNGTVSYSVSAYTGTSPQTYVLKIADQTFSISQTGCSYAINPAIANVGTEGGTGTVSVTATPGCAWTASTLEPSLLTITSGPSGTGNGTISYTMTPNGGASCEEGRAAHIIIADGKWFSLIQAAQNCTVSLSSTPSTFTASGGKGTATVTAPSSCCSWTATSNDSWAKVSDGGSGAGNGTVSFSVDANTGTTTRYSTINVKTKYRSGSANITQAGAGGCSYTVSPTNASLSSAAGTGSVSITTGSGCAWTATSYVDWITVTSGASGTGNGSVGYSFRANTSTSTRSGTIWIANQTFTVTQAAQSCTYTISPTSQNLGASASTGSVTVTAGSGCPWQASSNTNWITVTSGASGSGNGPVSYAVTANTTTSSRSGALTIAGQTFNISQAGGTTCTYSISPTSKSFTAAAGTGTVTVTAGSGCAWSATGGNTSWLTVTGGVSASGNGTVSYAVTANTTASSRSGTLTIAGQAHTVTQTGQSCTYSISPTSNSFASATGTGSVSVTSGSGCAWTATSNNTSWLTVTSGATGSGTGTVGYSVTANTTTTSRTGTLTIAGQTFTVTQAGAATCTYSISPASNSFTKVGGTGTVTVTTPASCTWTAASNVTWISITSKASGSVSYSVTANTTTTSRTGTLTIAGQTHTVTQAGGSTCTYSISPNGTPFTAAAGTGYVGVTAASGCTWTAISNNTSWLTVTSGASGSGNGTVGYSVAANTTTTSRTGTLTIAGQAFTVTQAGATTCTYSISPVSNSFTAAAGTGTVNVTAPASCTWTATSNVTWISITSKASGWVSYSVAANATTTSRTGTLTIAGQTHTVTQAGASKICPAYVANTQLSFDAGPNYYWIGVTSDSTCAWTFASNASWIKTYYGGSGKGNGSFIIAVDANTGPARTGSFSVNGTVVTVTQKGAAGK